MLKVEVLENCVSIIRVERWPQLAKLSTGGRDLLPQKVKVFFFCSKKWKWHKSHQRWPQWAKLSIEDEFLLQFLNGKVKVTQVSSTFNKGSFHLPIESHTACTNSELWSYLRIVKKIILLVQCKLRRQCVVKAIGFIHFIHRNCQRIAKTSFSCSFK